MKKKKFSSDEEGGRGTGIGPSKTNRGWGGMMAPEGKIKEKLRSGKKGNLEFTRAGVLWFLLLEGSGYTHWGKVGRLVFCGEDTDGRFWGRIVAWGRFG